MKKTGFDNELYVKKQTENILKRIDAFGNKLYLEFGGKLFDDLHAARVLPGFDPNVKTKILRNLNRHHLRQRAPEAHAQPSRAGAQDQFRSDHAV